MISRGGPRSPPRTRTSDHDNAVPEHLMLFCRLWVEDWSDSMGSGMVSWFWQAVCPKCADHRSVPLQVPPALPRIMAAQEKRPLLPHKPHTRQKFVLIIHGGAGTISRATTTPERQALYKAALKTALEAGYAVLREGGEAMDAAVAAVTVLESGCFHQLSQNTFIIPPFRLSALQCGQRIRL